MDEFSFICPQYHTDCASTDSPSEAISLETVETVGTYMLWMTMASWWRGGDKEDAEYDCPRLNWCLVNHSSYSLGERKDRTRRKGGEAGGRGSGVTGDWTSISWIVQSRIREKHLFCLYLEDWANNTGSWSLVLMKEERGWPKGSEFDWFGTLINHSTSNVCLIVVDLSSRPVFSASNCRHWVTVLLANIELILANSRYRYQFTSDFRISLSFPLRAFFPYPHSSPTVGSTTLREMFVLMENSQSIRPKDKEPCAGALEKRSDYVACSLWRGIWKHTWDPLIVTVLSLEGLYFLYTVRGLLVSWNQPAFSQDEQSWDSAWLSNPWPFLCLMPPLLQSEYLTAVNMQGKRAKESGGHSLKIKL